MLEIFLKGFALGLAIAAPVGPVGLQCIRKTLQFGKISGLCAGLGAAAADTFYGSLAIFGMTFLSSQLQTWGGLIRLIGSFFLLYLGYRTFRSTPPTSSDRLRHIGLLKDFVGTFFLTLTNPLTVLCYLAVFAAFGWTEISADRTSNLFLVFGVFFGAAAWWLIVSEGIGLLRHKLNEKTMIWINRISGLVIGGFGIISLISLFF